jgi:hypothetical protein
MGLSEGLNRDVERQEEGEKRQPEGMRLVPDRNRVNKVGTDGSAPSIGMSGSHSDTASAKSGLYWFFAFDFLQTTAGKDGTIETNALDVP